MDSGTPQDSIGSRRPGPHLLLYDGECGLCNGLVQAVLKRDPSGIFNFAALQSRAAAEQLALFDTRKGRTDPVGDTVIVIADYSGSHRARLTRAKAALFVLSALGWPKTSAAILRTLPITLLDKTYDLIARNRQRLFRRPESCIIPRPEHQKRFLDSTSDLGPNLEVSQ